MDNENVDPKQQSRPPEIKDLVKLCRELNALGARFIVIGGMAMIQVGFTRATEDIDLLIEGSEDNQQKVKAALLILPDQAVKELSADDLQDYTVVRVADEIVVDLMKEACGLKYDDARSFVQRVLIDGVEIPFANPQLLWKLKQTGREKDALDILFLKELLKK